MPVKPKADQAPEPLVGVEPGDRVFFTHGKEPHSGTVICHGKHGCTIDHDGQPRKVRWDSIIGHHTRASRDYQVEDRGLSGAIVLDKTGKRRFVNGEIPAEDGRPAVPAAEDYGRVREIASKAATPLKKGMLVDVSHCCDHHATEALDELFMKAASDGSGYDPMEPHHSPFIQRIIELFTERGLLRSGAMKDELDAWLAGQMHNPSPKTVVPPGYMERWSADELKLVKLYLEALAPDQFTLNDWMLCVDYLAQKYFPADELKTEAEWFASRSAIMGKVQSKMADLALTQADKVLAAVPAAAAVAGKLGPSVVDQKIIEFGAARCMESVVSIVSGSKQAVKQAIIEYQRAQMLGDKSVTFESLQTKLFDRFAALNTDWRRIAVTEAGENANQGLIASLAPGTKVRRLEQYDSACGFCRKIHGVEMTVVSPGAQDKDGSTQVWVGKNNIGRSGSPYKKTPEGLVKREPDELWWVPAGTVHPHCRGMWQVLKQVPTAGDAKFTDWLNAELRKTGK